MAAAPPAAAAAARAPPPRGRATAAAPGPASLVPGQRRGQGAHNQAGQHWQQARPRQRRAGGQAAAGRRAGSGGGRARPCWPALAPALKGSGVTAISFTQRIAPASAIACCVFRRRPPSAGLLSRDCSPLAVQRALNIGNSHTLDGRSLLLHTAADCLSPCCRLSLSTLFATVAHRCNAGDRSGSTQEVSASTAGPVLQAGRYWGSPAACRMCRICCGSPAACQL